MSDDDYYDDDDSHSGGLWDPDALSPPPAPRRPVLHAVPPPEPRGDVAAKDAELSLGEERLVRLDEFRPVPQDENRLAARSGVRARRRAMAASVAALAVSAMVAMGVGRLTGDNDTPTKPPGRASIAPDVEQAALTRTVESTARRSPNRPAGKRRSTHRPTTSRESSKAHRDRSAAPASRQTSTQATTVVGQRPTAPDDTTSVTSATSQPAKAQSATAACEFPPC